MATIGLDKMYYAKITEDDLGNETYGDPVILAKAISAELSIELAEAVLYADDSAAYVVKDFKSGTLNLGVDDIGVTAAQDLTGAVTDDNGVLVSLTENESSPVAIGFRALKPDGHYRYFWLYRVMFGIPSTNLATKGDSITFQTPTISGTVLRRNRTDAEDKHPWKVEVTEGLPGTNPAVIEDWFSAVYEPVFAPKPEPVTITVTLDPQGGTVVPATLTLTEGDPFGTLPTPTYEQHTFNGWFTQATGGTQVTETTIADGTVTTLYAQWADAAPETTSATAKKK